MSKELKFMRNNLKLLFSDNIIKTSFMISIALIMVQSLLVMFFFTKLPPLIPFLNSQPWGETRLYASSIIFLLPTFYLSVFIINYFLSAIYYQKNTLIARTLSFNCLLFMLLGILAFVQILLLVY